MVEKKKPHGVQLLIRTVVTNPEGKVISDSGQKKARSFVIQFLEFIFFIFEVGATQTATATDGTEDRMYEGSRQNLYHFEADAGINVDTHGVVVGTGDTAADNEDYALETQLTEGVGAGNITHGESVIEDTAVVGANVDLEVKRSFPNNTGSTITVKEAGVYVLTQSSIGNGYFCIIRDVLGVPVVLPDLCALTVYYTFRTTV